MLKNPTPLYLCTIKIVIKRTKMVFYSLSKGVSSIGMHSNLRHQNHQSLPPHGRRIYYRRISSQEGRYRDIYGSFNATASDEVNESWKPALESIDDMSLDILERHLEMFQRADTDKNGVLDKDELRAVLESVGDGTESLDGITWLTDDDLESILRQYDSDGNGVIDQEEFRKLAQDNVFLTRALKEYKAMFDALDTGGNGVIGPTELYQFFEKNADSCSNDQGSFEHVCGLIDRYDLNNDGVINFPEFLRLCRFEKALPLDDILEYTLTSPAPPVVCTPMVKETYTSPYESGMVHMITSKDEFTTALEGERGKRLIVLFGSLTWCRPCKKIQPQLEKIAKAYPDVLFLKLYGNENDQTKMFFKDDLKVRVTPCFFFFKDGELAGSCTGANPTTVETQMRNVLGTEASTPMLYP